MNGICCAGTGTHLETAASTPERDYGGQGGDRSLQGNSRLYMVITCRQFRSCRLYSWIRFTWTSNMEDGLIFTLYSFSRNWENFILFSCGEWTGQSPLRQKPWLSGGAHTLSSTVRAEILAWQSGSPASLWLSPGGRCRHSQSCAASLAGSSLSRSPLRFSINLKEKEIQIIS